MATVKVTFELVVPDDDSLLDRAQYHFAQEAAHVALSTFGRRNARMVDASPVGGIALLNLRTS